MYKNKPYIFEPDLDWTLRSRDGYVNPHVDPNEQFDKWKVWMFQEKAQREFPLGSLKQTVHDLSFWATKDDKSMGFVPSSSLIMVYDSVSVRKAKRGTWDYELVIPMLFNGKTGNLLFNIGPPNAFSVRFQDVLTFFTALT